MRKLIISLLNGYRKFNLFLLRLRGKTPKGLAEARVVSGQAWEEYCDTLKAAGAALQFTGAPRDPFNQAEGYRYLSRLARAGLEAFIEHANPEHPTLRHVVHETIKMGSDNPDNLYLHASVDGNQEYRIVGKRGSVHYLSFGTQIGHYGQGRGMPPTGFLEAKDLKVDDQGNFELILSKQQRPGNYLPMTSETGTLIVRQTFLDRSKEQAAELRIENLAPRKDRSAFSAEKLDYGLKQAGTLVAGASMLFAKWANDFQAHSNQLPLFDVEKSNRAGGDPNIRYYHSHFRLNPGEALIVRTSIPVCEHWNFQLNNYWLESLDYRYHQITLNKATAELNQDGTLTLIITEADPKHPNWIETAGHQEGTMTFRWILAESHPTPSTEVVSAASLPAVLEAERARLKRTNGRA